MGIYSAQSYYVSNSRLCYIGSLGTIIYLGFIVPPSYHMWARYDWHLIKPNELGDFVAGILTPLTLFWLILGFFQQRQELSQNTAALRAQADELEKSVEQQTLLAQSTNEQAESNRRALAIDQVIRAPQCQPVIQFISSGFVKKDSIQFEMQFRNIGQSAYNLSIRIQEHGFRSLFVDRLPTICNLEQFCVDWDVSGIDEIPTDFEAELRYQDQYLSSFKQSVSLRRDDESSDPKNCYMMWDATHSLLDQVGGCEEPSEPESGRLRQGSESEVVLEP